MLTSVSESTGYGPNREMSAFGYLVALPLVVLLIPLVPIIALVWLFSKLFGTDEGSPSTRAKRPPSA
ncbi:DUF7535 family protein [Salinilacihabitans rarus]|uniref:DUF7535 family protein n=1 Tax=Salinilacihabitans rarus TaxID=2961596 RepID=UPI0020C8935C|nr:hypothetical protein [Salinilacihabitans rarus]